MASSGSNKERKVSGGWDSAETPLQSGLAYHEGLRPLGGGLSSPTLGSGGVPPPGFNGGNTGNEIWSKDPSSSRAASGGGMDNYRSSSFNNLAAVFGSGLAESINDAVLTENFFSSEKNGGDGSAATGDLNYARQSRHMASRMVGSSGSDPITTMDAGPLFASLDSRDRLPKYAAGGGGGGGRGGSHRSNDFSRDRDRSVGGLYSTMDGYGTAFHHHQDRNPRGGGGGGFPSGMTVTEPSDGLGGRQDDATMDLQRKMNNLWSDNGDQAAPKSATPTDPRELQRQSEDDLRPFAWDVRHHEPSRALVLMRASALSAADVRAACEVFGVIDTFRSDFADRGIFFVSYYDMRSAQYASMELPPKLRGGDKVLVQFCVPLNSSSQFDDSLVVLNDVPMDMNIESLAQMLSSYGAVRSLRSLGGNYGGTSFVAEFHDVQDAKQAVLELESTQPWGPNVSVEIGARNPSDRKRGRELLALIGRWRHGESGGGAGGDAPMMRRHASSGSIGSAGRYHGGHHSHHHRDQPRNTYIPGSHGPRHDIRYERGGDRGYQSYVVVNHSGYPQSYGNMPPYHGDHTIHSNHGTYIHHHGGPSHQYWSGPPSHHNHHFSGSSSVVSASSAYSDGHHSGHYPTSSRSVPYFPDGGSIGSHSHNIRSVPEGGTPNRDEKDNRHLKLDVDAVENGRDSRTSLMVRNIPNKYTQQMLLSEFSENGHGPGTIDFFYLPIDFKNKCNRGYAFINFVDYRDILPFHRRYYGKHWRTFNSDKICEITYARIQGKSAMLKRFENSALMEKDEEYKPLVFVSNGPDRGKSLPFPDPSNRS